MAIITVSRQRGSLSHEIAPGIADKLGYLCIDGDMIRTALEGYNIDMALLDKFNEKKPGFMDSFSVENEKYFNYFKLFFFEKAYSVKGCILLGWGGGFLLEGIPGVLRVRLVASEATRLERLMVEGNCDEKEAKRIMIQSDRERIGFHKYHYQKDWTNPESYDISFNTDSLSTDTIGIMLHDVISSYLKKEYKIEGKNILKDKLLAQKIIVKILYEENMPVHMLEVEVSGSSVTLTGTVEVESMKKKCTEVALIEGIDSIQNNIVFVSQYPPII